jgi:hypothetical protein
MEAVTKLLEALERLPGRLDAPASSYYGGGRLRLIATLHDPAVIRKLLPGDGPVRAESRPRAARVLIGSARARWTPSCLCGAASSALTRPGPGPVDGGSVPTQTDEQRARGHRHGRALRALGAKWLKIIFIMWQRQVPYSEEQHLATMARQALRHPEKNIA